MYNINFQNNLPNYNYYYNQYNNNKYSYDLKTKEKNEIIYPNSQYNNNLNNYQESIINNYQNSYYNYMPKTPTPSPHKKTLINNNYNHIQLISKSPEPYIRLYKKEYYKDNEYPSNSNISKGKDNEYPNNSYISKGKDKDYPNNSFINKKKDKYRINIKIKKLHKPIFLPNKLEENVIKAKTPEPNLRKRNRAKNSKKNKINIYITKTYEQLKTNENDNSYKVNKNNNNSNLINKEPYLKKQNYNQLNEINNISQYNYNSNLSDLSSNNNNYYYYNRINSNPTSNIINQFYTNDIYGNQINTIDIRYKNNKYQNVDLRGNNFAKKHHIEYMKLNKQEPNDNFNSAEFIIINLIGQGSFGKIYCVQWIKNNKLYAMKKLEIQNLEELKSIQDKVKMIKELYRKTNHYGFVKILGDKCIPLYNYHYNYFIIMELGERDWEKEIQLRFLNQNYYTEYELFQIIYQLVKTLSLMQRYKVSHRDIKPQNILIMNGIYKICDFGEARIVNGNGVVIQHVRGSQLYMSPILFYAYNHNVSQVLHNTYKSDVFSLGMCILLAATLSGYTLYNIRELIDIKTISNIIINTLNTRYSLNIINLIIKMLQIDENLRMDFIELEGFISNFLKK